MNQLCRSVLYHIFKIRNLNYNVNANSAVDSEASNARVGSSFLKEQLAGRMSKLILRQNFCAKKITQNEEQITKITNNKKLISNTKNS